MTGYEQELRKLFENSGLIDRPQFSGRVCVIWTSILMLTERRVFALYKILYSMR